jgi:PAS domain S-box-containing protein
MGYEEITSEHLIKDLHKYENRFQAFFNLPLIGMAIVSPDMQWIEVNDSFCKMTGYTRKELLKMTWADITPKEELKQELNTYYSRIRSGEIAGYILEKHYIRKNGAIISVAVLVNSVKKDNDSIDYLVALIQDITESKLAKELLRESENKFHLLFEKSLDPVVLLYNEKYIDCNEAAVRIMGCSSKEELIGLGPEKTSPDLQPDGEKSVVKAGNIIARTMRDGSSRFEWVHKKMNGEEFWSDISLTAITINGKNFIYDVWKDITDKKNIEEALRKSEIRYRRMFSYNPLPAFVFDFRTLKIIDVNEAAIMHYGYTYEEFTKMNTTELHPPGDVPFVLSHLNKPRLGKTKGSWKHVKKDGTLIDVEISGHTLEFSDKLCRIAIVNDVTDRIKAEEELKRSYEQLRILSAHINQVREKERKGVARELHDELGQILTTLNMDISWIKKRLSVETGNTLLYNKVDAMSVLIKQAIKQVQKVSAELRPVILDDFGLVPALEWAISKFKNQIDIDVKMTVGDGIDLDGERSTQIYRIVQESLTNIARHASATKLSISLEKEGNNIVVEIKDNGKGISDKEIADQNSFGILSMKERATMLGAAFTIKGIRGKGTIVKVNLPLSTQDLQEGEIGAPASRGVAMPVEGATPLRGQAQADDAQSVKGLNSTHGAREGEAPRTLFVEGATLAPGTGANRRIRRQRAE